MLVLDTHFCTEEDLQKMVLSLILALIIITLTFQQVFQCSCQQLTIVLRQKRKIGDIIPPAVLMMELNQDH